MTQTRGPGGALPLPSTADEWLLWLGEETRDLDELGALARACRQAAVGKNANEEALQENLERQSAVCDRLEARKSVQRTGLASSSRRGSDLLEIVLALTPASRKGAVVEIFRTHLAAAEAAQKEIRINRNFFEGALSAVTSAIDAARMAAGGVDTYDARGVRPGGATAICLSASA